MEEPSLIQARIHLALKLHGRSMLWLQKQLKSAGAPGSSYASVHRYLTSSAQPEPPLGFLRAVAKALDVSESWLVLGDLMGEPRPQFGGTTLGQLAESSEKIADEIEREEREVHRAISREFPPFRAFPTAIQNLILNAFDRYSSYFYLFRYELLPRAERQTWSGSDLELAAAFGRVLQGPLREFGLRYTDESLTAARLQRYTAAMFTALVALLPEEQELTATEQEELHKRWTLKQERYGSNPQS